jgi:hypothetical protein
VNEHRRVHKQQMGYVDELRMKLVQVDNSNQQLQSDCHHYEDHLNLQKAKEQTLH